jgi:hypothetical protein
MEKTHIVPKIYGYAVCLASIIVTFIAVANIVSAAFDRIDPVNVRSYSYNIQTHNVSSFEAYKAEYQSNLGTFSGDKTSAVQNLSDAELRANYEATRESQISAVKVGSAKSMTMYGALLLVAIILFVTHWRWLRKLDK